MSEKIGSIHYDLDLDNSKFKKGLSNSIKNAEASSQKVLGAIGAIGGGILAVGVQAIQSAAKFETMAVSLETAFQGNEEAARKARRQITDFAAKTPFELEQVMNAFIKLKNMGLDPSERALTAYGDTASAMGKTLNDMVEAVADAATGEFERLKEFGIRSSIEGDKVKFTFQGVTTTVKKNAGDIEDYLIKLGETKFAGGMADQSETLSGLMSTLNDEISFVLANLARDSGIFDIVKQLVADLTVEIDNLAVAIEDAGGLFDFLKQKLEESEEPIYIMSGAILVSLVPAFVALGASIWTALAPLLPFIAIGALLGFIVFKLVEAFGGWEPLLKTVQEGLTTIWNNLKQELMPQLVELKDAFLLGLLPALKQFWTLVEPVVIPALKILGQILGIVIVAALWIFINVLTILINWWSILFNWLNAFIKWIPLFARDVTKLATNIGQTIWRVSQDIGFFIGTMMQRFADIFPGVVRSLANIGNAIINAFKGAFDWLSKKTAEVKNTLDRLNPFHRESPSLIDWIDRGTDQMLSTYGNMFDRLNMMSAENRLGLLGAAETVSMSLAGAGNGSLAQAPTIVNINPQGIVATSRTAYREIIKDGISAVNEELRSMGKPEIGGGAIEGSSTAV